MVMQLVRRKEFKKLSKGTPVRIGIDGMMGPFSVFNLDAAAENTSAVPQERQEMSQNLYIAVVTQCSPVAVACWLKSREKVPRSCVNQEDDQEDDSQSS